MENEHLRPQHISSLWGSEWQILISLTQTSFYPHCLAEEEQAGFISGSHVVNNISQVPTVELLLLVRMSEAERHSWILRSQTESALLAGRQTSF